MKTIKNRLLLIISVIVSLTIVNGCVSIKDGAFFTKYYIHVYINTETVKCMYEPDTKLIYTRFEGKRILMKSSEFVKVAESFGDTYYNRKLVPFGNRAVMDRFLSIDMVSDQDFDQAHPAGTSLADIVKFIAGTDYPYVSSGYKGENCEYTHDPADGEVYSNRYSCPVSKLLKDWTPTDMLLLSESGNFRFMVSPPVGEHNFKITFRSADKTLVTNLKVNFE